MDTVTKLFEKAPKAELHMHIEGSLEPELMFDLAARNNIDLPFASVEEIRAAYQFSELQDFLDIYYQGMSVLQTEQDFDDLAYAYGKRSAADNVTHTEIFFDPQGHVPRGVPFETALNGLVSGLARVEAEFGMTSSIIMCFLRHLDETDAERTLDMALAHKDRIIGVGLDSSENGFPPTLFKNVFRRARDEGFLLVAHAGEEGPPEYVWDAIDVLGIDRIDHGNRALEDQELVRRIARDGLTLTVCPLSNLRLCGVTDMKAHPIRRMLDAGLKATVNSDDPAYFGGYVNDNFTALHKALTLTAEETTVLLRNSFEGSFMSEDQKKAALGKFETAIG